MSGTRRWRHAARRSVFGAALALAAGCGTITDAGDASIDLRGSWRYAGEQSTGEQLFLDGTLAVTTRSGPTFGGSITVDERNARGAVRSIVGIVGGTVYSNGVIDMDVALDAATLRHVGTISADTLRGNWTTADGLRSGSFRAVRTRP
jgi:hypothetical protein